jgi:hypothetical protein
MTIKTIAATLLVTLLLVSTKSAPVSDIFAPKAVALGFGPPQEPYKGCWEPLSRDRPSTFRMPGIAEKSC